MLGGSVDVVGLDAHLVVDELAHALGPGLGSEQSLAELGVVLDADAHGVGDVVEVDQVGRGARDGGDAEVLDELDLPLGVAGAGGQDGRPDLLAAVVGAEAAGEQAVAVGDLEDVPGSDADGGHGAGEGLGPVVQVVLGVSDQRGLPGGTGGDVVPHDLVLRNGEELVRVVVAQVLLVHERELADVRQTGDVVRVDLVLDHAVVVELVEGIEVVDQLFELAVLELLELLHGHAFDSGVPVHVRPLGLYGLDAQTLLKRYYRDGGCMGQQDVWDSFYRSNGRAWRGNCRMPDPLGGGGDALDLGCGSGKSVSTLIDMGYRAVGLDFCGTQPGGDLVENAIDELVAIDTTERFGQFDRFVDDDPVGNFDMVGQFVGADEQDGMFYG